MNRIMKETLDAMGAIEAIDSQNITSKFEYPSGFIGFQGHFDAQPVLPAICILEAVKALLCEWSKENYVISEVKNAKFFNPIGASEAVDIALTIDDKHHVTASINSKDEKKAKLKLMFRKTESECASD